MIADEHSSYNCLVGLNDMMRVNHAREYQAEDGTNTNQVEGFFSRLERSHIGTHHRFSMKYLDWYVADLAWREDNRRQSNEAQTIAVLKTALGRPTSRYLCGYWQGNKPPDLIWTGEVAA